MSLLSAVMAQIIRAVAPPSGGAWTPAEISTRLWLDTSDSNTLFDATSGGSTPAADGEVLRIEDKSGNGRHYTNGNAGQRPLRKASAINGLDTLLFDGSNDRLRRTTDSPMPSGSGSYTWLVVARSSNVTSTLSIMSGGALATNNAAYLFRIQNNGQLNDGWWANNLNTANGAIAVNTPFMAAFRFVSGSGRNIFVNGTSVASDSATAKNTGAGYDLLGCTANNASEGSPAQFFPGDFCEAIVLADDSDRLRCEGYLAHKWGLEGELPSGHPYKAAPPTVDPLWTPAEISTALWLDAADAATITEVSGAVSEWSDKSGNGLHVSQGTASARPVRQVAEQNGLDVLRFDGSNDRLTRFSASHLGRNVGQLLVLGVRRHASVPTSNRILMCFSHSTVTSFRATVEAGRTSSKAGCGGRRLDANSFQQVVSSANVTTGFQLQAADFRYSDADLYQYINGSLEGSSTSFQTAGNTSDTASERLAIGATVADTGSEWMNGDIAEIVVLHNDPANRQRVEGYLAHKWGLEGDLPGGHPYKHAAPTTAWTPADISTAAWFDADDPTVFTLTGSDIDQWADKSGNARHATPPGTKPTRTAAGINSMGSVVYGSGEDYLVTPSFANPSGADGLMVLMVAEKTAEPVNYTIPLCKGAVNAEYSIVWPKSTVGSANGASKSILRHLSSSGQQATSATDYGLNTPRVLSGFLANAGIQQFFAGSAEGSSGAGTRDFGGPSVMYIGGHASSGLLLQGRIAEIVVVHADVTIATRQKLEGYLAHKWGLESDLPADHPYKAAPPTIGCSTAYETDFESYTVGSLPPGWTTRWATNFGTNGSWRVETVSSNKVLRMITDVNAWRGCESPAGSFADGSIVFRTQWSNYTNSFVKSYALARASGGAGSEAGYQLQLRSTSTSSTANQLDLVRLVGGAATVLDTAVISIPHSTWVWVRLECEGSTVRGRHWTGALGDEPSGWDVEATDETYASGWWGVGARNLLTTYLFDDVTVTDCD